MIKIFSDFSSEALRVAFKNCAVLVVSSQYENTYFKFKEIQVK